MGVWNSRVKVLPRKELAQRSRELRAEQKRLILTNGCFDVLHIGHVRYLQQARALGDVLIVGVNGDASVRQLKGAGRPVTPENERAEILAALAAVDFVVIFEEETAISLVAEVQPAIYVKGGDYSANPDSDCFPREGHKVAEMGGRVVIVDHIPDSSTTSMLRRLTEPRPEGSV